MVAISLGQVCLNRPDEYEYAGVFQLLFRRFDLILQAFGSDTPENFLMEQRALQGHLVFRPPFGYRKEIIDKQEGHKRTRIISQPVVLQRRTSCS